jgi:hypothetical protein
MGAWHQDTVADRVGRNTTLTMTKLGDLELRRIESVQSCSCETREAGSWGPRQYGNPEKGVCPVLEAATKQRLLKTEKTLHWSLECVSQRDCRSYL